MKQQHRFLLALVASAAVLILWNYFFPPPKPPQPNANANANVKQAASPSASPTAQALATVTPTPAQASASPAPAATPDLPQRKLRIVTPLYEATFDTHGAVATSWILRKIKRPDGTSATITLAEKEDGIFTARFNTTVAGTYRFRVRARGRTRKGMPFARERTLTVAVWRGGDRDAETAGSGDRLINFLHERDAKLCELLKCLANRDGVIDVEFAKRLRALGLDLDHLRECLQLFCRGKDMRNNDVDA